MLEWEQEVRPYSLQVGGHNATDPGAPASLLDKHGRFLKKLQPGERGAREVAFYSFIEQHRGQQHLMQQDARQQQTMQQAKQKQQQKLEQPSQQPEQSELLSCLRPVLPSELKCGCCGDLLQHSLMERLADWVPHSYGTQKMCGGDEYLVLEDLTAGYTQPCILDIKMGYRTWYGWASEALKEKYRSKDESTTQATLGFRLCGMLMQRAAAAAAVADSQFEVVQHDRHWGKALTENDMSGALRAFADNGHLTLADLCQGPNQLLQQLQALNDIFEQQKSWHFFSASLLVLYEGAATSSAATRLQLRLIDYAHAFPVANTEVRPPPPPPQQQQQPTVDGSGAAAYVGPVGRDQNVLDGLKSLIKVLQEAL